MYEMNDGGCCIKFSLSVQVVPLALVCLLTGCSLMEAKSHLEQQPIVREAVAVIINTA